ncbi:hypothetical protein OH77DRAFT_1431055, partial [Trametes cingulata]
MIRNSLSLGLLQRYTPRAGIDVNSPQCLFPKARPTRIPCRTRLGLVAFCIARWGERMFTGLHRQLHSQAPCSVQALSAFVLRNPTAFAPVVLSLLFDVSVSWPVRMASRYASNPAGPIALAFWEELLILSVDDGPWGHRPVRLGRETTRWQVRSRRKARLGQVVERMACQGV